MARGTMRTTDGLLLLRTRLTRARLRTRTTPMILPACVQARRLVALCPTPVRLQVPGTVSGTATASNANANARANASTRVWRATRTILMPLVG